MKRILKSTMTAALVLLLVSLCGCGAKEIDPRTYTEVNFEGLNGSGRAYVTFDYDVLTSAITDEDDEAGLQDYLSKLAVLSNAIKVTCEVTEGLSNGDQIEVTYTVDEELLDSLDIKLKGTSETFVVQDLPEPVIIDAFLDVDVVFQGYSPAATAIVNNNSTHEFLKYVQYTLDQTSGLSNGDTVTVTANYSYWEAESLGYVLLSETKEYVVKNRPEWATTAQQIDTAARESLAQQALDSVIATLSSISGTSLDTALTGKKYYMTGEARSFTYTEPRKVSELLLVNKFLGDNNYDPNLYVILYEVPVEITLNKTGEVVYTGNAYFCVCFNSLSVTAEGITEANLQSSKIYYTYASLDSAYTERVYSNTEYYAIIDMLAE